MSRDENLPSKLNTVVEPITDGDAYSPMSLGVDGPSIVDGQEFIARYAIERYGWIDDPAGSSASAQAFAREVYERYPAIRNDEHRMVVDIVQLLSHTIPDPNDWDHIGSALDMIQYMEQSR